MMQHTSLCYKNDFNFFDFSILLKEFVKQLLSCAAIWDILLEGTSISFWGSDYIVDIRLVANGVRVRCSLALFQQKTTTTKSR